MVLKLIKRLLSKETTMMAETEQKKPEIYHVWTKTERAGQIVQIDGDAPKDPQWVYFTDGTRINRTLMNEYLLTTTSLNEAKNTSKILGHESIESINPKTKTKSEPTQQPVIDNRPPMADMATGESKTVTTEVNVMMAMLQKMSAKNKAAMPVEVNLPSKEVYDMLIDQMDVEAEELNEQIVLLIESQIDNMKQKLNEQIQLFTNNYYNGRTNTTSTKQKNASRNSETERDA
jgi:hypothetical protein